MNAAFEAMTGYTAAEAMGQAPRFLRSPFADPADRTGLREALAAWGPGKAELLNTLGAMNAYLSEAGKLLARDTWDLASVREWIDVAKIS